MYAESINTRCILVAKSIILVATAIHAFHSLDERWFQLPIFTYICLHGNKKQMLSKNTRLFSILRTSFVFLGLFACVSTYAGDTFTFTPINGLNGLSDKGVRSLSQLPDGRMVVVTEGLVHLYDGATFHYMHYDERKAYPLSGYTGYHHIYTDNENHLWIKNTHTLFLFDTRTESFVPELDAYWKKQGVKDAVSDFFIDTQQGMWLLTQSDQLLYRNAQTKPFRTIASSISRKTGLKDVLYDVAVLEKQVYLFYRSGWIISLNTADGKEVDRITPFPHRTNPYTNTLMVVPHQQYLYQVRNGDHTSLLNRFDVQKQTWETVMETDYCLNTLTIDNKGDCWMSSYVGLWKIDHQTLKKQLVSPLKLVDGSSLETEISAQYTDKSGGLWVGTFNRGLLYYHPEKWLFKRFERTAFPTPTKSRLSIGCFAVCGGSILVGTTGGLYEQQAGKGNLRRFPSIPSTVTCNALYTDSRKRIWLCTERDGLYEIDGRTVRKHPFTFPCRYLFEDRKGHFYLCGDQGFGLFNPGTGAFQTIETVEKAQLGAVVQLISFGKDTLLGLSRKGLFQFDTHTREIQFPATGEHPRFVHPNRQYNCLFADSHGRIWFGTQDGLNVYDPGRKTARIFHREDGLTSNTIRGIAEEPSGTLWVTTSNGISSVDIIESNGSEAFFFNAFDKNQGVSERDFNPRSIFIAGDRQLFCGHSDGFNTLAINREVREKNRGTKPVFTRLSVAGTEIKAGSTYNGNILLPEALSSITTLTLDHNQQDITLECSAFNYIHPDQPYFRYRLKGHEKSWNVQHSNDGICRIHLADLHPGTYRLTVFASNNPRDWNTPGTTLTLVVKPSVFGTPLAIVLYVILFIGTGLVVATAYRKRLSAQRETTRPTLTSTRPRDIAVHEKDVVSSEDALLQKVLGFIEKNLDNPAYSVEQLSKDMAMDRTNLYRKLSAAAGMTPSDFIRSVRLKHAAQLLEKGYRVSEVASEVGFGTTSYFSKCFQEMFGVAPSQYKKGKDSEKQG